MTAYPTGTVAFLFTDIESSTRRWESQQQAMWIAVERHFALLREAIESRNGVLFKTVGDAVQAAFPSVPDAVAAAVAGQSALRQEDWGDLGPLRVRMAVHVGEASPRDGDYLAPPLNRLARVLSSGYGEQILLTEAAQIAAGTTLPPGCDLLDLGAHRLRDLLQAEHIYQVRGPGLVADFPPLKSLDRHLHNLPAQPTALLGRETEIEAARTLIQQDDVRLVTLTGPGGTGKTRLGIQVAAELVDAFADGIWFVPLAAVADPDLVTAAIAQPLGVREVPGEPLLQTLQDYLRSRHALLVLDNFEHVTAAAPDIAALLADCPTVKVLATSREPLRIRGERELPVPPLALPPVRQTRHLSPAELLEFSAIRLFVERAGAVNPGFALTEDNASDVAAICQRLDGLPLAIELAAARARILAPSQILTRLDKRLKLLTGGSRDLPARQQTLRAAIEWSYDLLNPDDQALFARLAVFAGGCTLEAAEAVCAEGESHTIDVLDGLESLAHKSLVRQTDEFEGEPRFTMLETIREYALERLENTGQMASIRGAHATYFLELAAEAEKMLEGPDQLVWLDRLDLNHDNLRATHEWLDVSAQNQLSLDLASSLWRFWWTRGHLSEGRGWLERSLAQTAISSPFARANALNGAGVLAESQGDYEQATAYHEEALALRRQIDDRSGTASSLTNLGIIASDQGDFERSTSLHSEALIISQEDGDEPGMSSSLFALGSLALNQGRYSAAREFLNQSLILSRKLRDTSAIGSVLENLGILAFYQEDYEKAARLYEESLALWTRNNDKRMIAHTLANLGEVTHLLGNQSSAEDLYSKALATFRELGDKRGISFALHMLGKMHLERGRHHQSLAYFIESVDLRAGVGERSAIIESLEGLAATACGLGEMHRTVRLFAAGDRLRHEIGTPLPTLHRREHDELLAMARQQLGATAFDTSWTEGQLLSIDQAVAEAANIKQSPVHERGEAQGLVPSL